MGMLNRLHTGNGVALGVMFSVYWCDVWDIKSNSYESYITDIY